MFFFDVAVSRTKVGKVEERGKSTTNYFTVVLKAESIEGEYSVKKKKSPIGCKREFITNGCLVYCYAFWSLAGDCY